MAKRKYVVELEKGVWLAPFDGDPGRTLDIKNAKTFEYKMKAQKALLKAKKDYPNRKWKHGGVRLVNVDSKISNCAIYSVSHFYSAGAKSKQRFEKEMIELNNIVGKNVAADERISELIEWYRKECNARPEIYKGDEIVVNAIKQGAMKGLSFNFSLMEAYRILKANFSFTDNMRAMG